MLCVQVQGYAPYLWVIVDEQAPRDQPRRFRLAGTGHKLDVVDPSYNPSPDNCGRYVGTFQLDGGALVFHLFEVTEAP